MKTKLCLAGALALVLGSAGVLAHVRLVSPVNLKPLRWNTPSNIEIVINSTGSDDIADESETAAIRLAIDEWNAVSGTSATLVEDALPSQQARTDWKKQGIHLVLFDETNTSEFFPPGSGTVAITPVLFNGFTGAIADADVLFNGDNTFWGFTTSAQPGSFDVQDVATHELGHLLGLDHTGSAGGTMYPYVDPTIILHRSASDDDARGLRDAYPSGAFGKLTGSVVRSSNASAVRGALVAARDADGRLVTSILSDDDGDFTLVGLEPGTYTVYARPLDQPVDEFNLGQGYTIQTDFEPELYAAPATIVATETVDLGTLVVGPDVSLNLGTAFDPFPFHLVDGTSTMILVSGTGLSGGSTLTASDPDFTLGAPMWNGNSVQVSVTVPAGELPGNVDLTVVDSMGRTSILPGALEVTPASPAVTMVTPGSGSSFGGTPVTIDGTGFRPGARVVIGDQIYVDGVGGTAVLGPTMIQLVTTATPAGLHDVVVVDPSGVEGRMASVFQAALVPAITGVFPPAGSAGGGTLVTLTGQYFLPGCAVRIDGVDQGAVTLPDATHACFTTLAGATGAGLLLEIENPGGGIATSVFTYAASADPLLATVAPDKGKTKGGETITLTGTDFSATTAVTFGVDPLTGAGGVPAQSVTFLGPTTLEVVTPAHGKGAVAVMVSDPLTEQASVLVAAFSFRAASGGGGGGGCSLRPFVDSVPPSLARDVALGSWWLAALLALLAVRARLRRPRADGRAA